MIYSDLILNIKNWGHIYRAWKNNRLPHALLFHGPIGIGKEAHAIELAALLNCVDIQNERACGTCPSCKKIISFQHECVKLILPLPRGKIASSNDSYMKAFKNEKVLQEYLDMLKEKGNNPYASLHVSGSSTILINSIREMKQNISMSMEKDQWKIILIFQAEKLCVPNPAAAHALLKILEEPPDQTIMILVSSKSDSIIDTIHSRCQSIYFPAINNTIIQSQLESMEQDTVTASIITRISAGNVSLSRQLIGSYADIMEKLYIFLNSCFSRDPSIWEKNIDISARLKNKDFRNLEQLFQFAILFFRDMLYFQNTKSTKDIAYKNQIEKIDKLCQSYPDADWQACIEHIENTQNYLLRNGYLPLMIINLIIDIQKSIQGKYHEPFQLSDWVQM